jgi:hypothetical protein
MTKNKFTCDKEVFITDMLTRLKSSCVSMVKRNKLT